MVFVETSAFSRYLSDYLREDDYLLLQPKLAQDPEAGDLMPGTGGFRKLRWPDPRRGKGRKGGLRIIYYYFAADRQILLMPCTTKMRLQTLRRNRRKH